MSIQHGYVRAFEITPSDTVNFSQPCEAIYVGTAGDVVAVVNGVAVTFVAPAGAVLPVKATRVNSTGTTATDLVGLWGQ